MKIKYIDHITIYENGDIHPEVIIRRNEPGNYHERHTYYPTDTSYFRLLETLVTIRKNGEYYENIYAR